MPAKTYLVVELTEQSDLKGIVNSIKGKMKRMAVVNAVPGIFGSTGVRPVKRRLRPNAEDAVPGVRRPKLEDEIVPPDVAAYVEYPAYDVDSEANIDVVTVDRRSGISSMLEKTMDDEGSCGADDILNVTNVSMDDADDVKENLAHLLEQSLDAEEFVDAEDVLPRKSGRKTRRSRLYGDGEYDVYSTRRKERSEEETLYCGLCNSSMTLRASYGRTRLREHVLRHLNMPTVKCGICGFEGILREHIRRHHSQSHPGTKFNCMEVELSEVFNDKFAVLWQGCYPDRPLIAARSNYKKLVEDFLDTSGTSKAEKEEPGSVSETMDALINKSGLVSDEELHEDDGEDDVKPNVEELVNESMITHPSA